MRFRSFLVGMGVPFVVACGAESRGPEVLRAPDAESHRAAVVPRTSQSQPTSPERARDLSKVEEPFTVNRQVEALERSIELYQAFIVRAGDDPEYADAVVRSKNRIDDARVTICFLLEKPCDEPH